MCMLIRKCVTNEAAADKKRNNSRHHAEIYPVELFIITFCLFLKFKTYN